MWITCVQRTQSGALSLGQLACEGGVACWRKSRCSCRAHLDLRARADDSRPLLKLRTVPARERSSRRVNSAAVTKIGRECQGEAGSLLVSRAARHSCRNQKHPEALGSSWKHSDVLGSNRKHSEALRSIQKPSGALRSPGEQARTWRPFATRPAARASARSSGQADRRLFRAA